MDQEATTTDKAKRRGALALLIGVIIMFLLVIVAWVVLINIALENPVEQVEVEENTQH